MLLQVPDVLTAAEVARCREALDAAEWVDGRVTAGFQSARAKDNVQVPEGHPAARACGELIVGALQRTPLFHVGRAAAARVPAAVQPLQRRPGVRHPRRQRHPPAAGIGHRIRTDLSATLFLTPPDDYDGGELMVEDAYGAHAVKLPAGHMVLYPATSLHHVRPVTRGARVGSFFWIQSMVADDAERTLLFDLDSAIRTLGRDVPDAPAVVQLTGIYHNLVRRWAQL